MARKKGVKTALDLTTATDEELAGELGKRHAALIVGWCPPNGEWKTLAKGPILTCLGLTEALSRKITELIKSGPTPWIAP